jgi:hypothetical protein
MKGQEEQLVWQLCEMAASEKDPEKVLALVREINRLLEEKHLEPKSQDNAPYRYVKRHPMSLLR